MWVYVNSDDHKYYEFVLVGQVVKAWVSSHVFGVWLGYLFRKSCNVHDLMLPSDLYLESLHVLSLFGPEARRWKK